MDERLTEMGLKFVPFELSGSGVPVTGERLWVPTSWELKVKEMLERITPGTGPKPVVIIGEYGSGKSYILNWLHRCILPGPDYRVDSFYFDNPGIQFYDIANDLLRDIGRVNFAKLIWELVKSKIDLHRGRFLEDSFGDWLGWANERRNYNKALDKLKKAILKSKEVQITDDEEIAYRLALLVIETGKKDFFDYRDFKVGATKALVAEKEEPAYFGAILRVLKFASGVDKVAFLIDEFEEVAFKKRLSSKQTNDYLGTLRRLINLIETEDLWLILAMTRQGWEVTCQLMPGLVERFGVEGDYLFEIPQLKREDALDLIKFRLDLARCEEGIIKQGAFPFPENVNEILSDDSVSSPRRVVKICYYALSKALRDPNISIPFEADFLRQIENEAYPHTGEEE